MFQGKPYPFYTQLALVGTCFCDAHTWASVVARKVEVRYSYRILVGALGGRLPLGGSRHRRDDNIKMGVKDAEY